MKSVAKAVVALVIGGTIFTFSQADIVKNFSKDTGLSQKEAEEYINSISEDELVSFDKLGSEMISDGQSVINAAEEIDCVHYEYEWESPTLSCNEGKSQLLKFGNSELSLGRSYKVLDTEDATVDDISTVINKIDMHNADHELEIITKLLNPTDINEARKTNSYNKSLLQAALDSQ